MKQHYFWKTACIIRETAQAVTIIFATQGDPFSFKAGQFINLTLSVNGERISRSYSLSSAPEHDEHPAITVKAVAGGIMSNYILSHAEEIMEWEIDGPHGLFHVTTEAESGEWVVLIGGGSGVTPLYSMLKYLLLSTKVNILLINSNKTTADVIFGKALMHIRQAYPQRFHLINVFTREISANDSFGENSLQGRLSRNRLKKIIKQSAGEAYRDAQYFICGPNGLMQLAVESLQSAGIEQAQIFTETFHPINEEKAELPIMMQEVLLHHYEQTNLLQIEPGKTILEVALDDHVPVQYSCKNGTCGICIGKLLQGNVYMRQNYALQAEQVSKGYILLCQSYPLDSTVTVEVNESI